MLQKRNASSFPVSGTKRTLYNYGSNVTGKPVIVTNYGGLPEIVEDGKTGFICSPFDSDDLKNSIKKSARFLMLNTKQ